MVIKNIISILKITGVFCVAALFVGLLFSNIEPHFSEASASDNLSGYAWSETIGWISMNNIPDGGADYGVTVAADGTISGYAWSEYIGWISFSASDVASCPTAPCAPVFNKVTGQVTGWAKALNGGIVNSGGWDGFISLSGSNYGVTVTGCTWSGWAWGSDVVGWVNFNGSGGTVVGTGDACVSMAGMNLTSESLSAGGATFTVGDTLSLSAGVRNTGSDNVTAAFRDNFTYSWDGGATWNNINPFSSHVSLTSGAVESDNATFVLSTAGTLYIRHYVDSDNVVDEGANETPNFTEIGPLAINPSTDCPFTTIDNCVVPKTPVGQSIDGSCVIGTIGVCNYSCTANGTSPGIWSKNTNTCAIPPGPPEFTGYPRMVDYGETATLTFELNGSASCTITGGTTNVTVAADGSTTTDPIYAMTTFTIDCGSGLTDTATVEIRPNGFET
jgi:hypothetical protein